MRTAVPDLAELAQALVPVTREAGRVIMDLYAGTVATTLKGDGSPVTEADRRAEAIILPALSALAPAIPVVSEESAASHGCRHGGPFFLVDPLDGTKEFLKRDGKGSFTVNIALVEGGEPALGIVLAPALGRLFIGIVGQGARELSADGTVRPLSVRQPSGDALVAVASASHRDAETEAWLKVNRIGDTVSIGSSLKFCLVAAGEADVYPRFGPTMEWDTAAGDAILRAAGGMTLAPEGTPFVYRKPGYRNGAFVAWGGGRP
ncbi:3'(2'),5'-bisphosphate nucleotidase CysQ [Albidovulum sediminicola]|uniref:3'(2'),5'-bisphosphate nucleotidase CysQ n=1 Tax=Albidovulum sediminicola TaxID=2984331 RepID=A0ABT2Z711_9RHOB|nr:3'(2'),5'-bisphosphate nucleotidase CysQ [Defluviimonas sp. WL0075]MCV2866566.1 3'(2'),5'-bisphosphate nucleotidase CysQ [Defluviimonas sp. WL0075]